MDNGASSYRRFLDGDESAFESIMQELFHGLVFFLHGYVHDAQAAEDLAIDTFSDLIVHKHRYNFKVTLKTYLYMIGRSRALDYLRKKKRFPLTERKSTSTSIFSGINAEKIQLLVISKFGNSFLIVLT